jgi:hypothetical protein
MAAVGIDGALSQRSYHIAQIYGTPPTRFYTNPANPAGPDPTRQYDWKYHQWTILPTPVYDGSLAFGAGTSPPKNMERPAYETALKAPPPFPPLPPGQVWNPLAFDPVQFCPNVVAYK